MSKRIRVDVYQSGPRGCNVYISWEGNKDRNPFLLRKVKFYHPKKQIRNAIESMLKSNLPEGSFGCPSLFNKEIMDYRYHFYI